jgi:hypothetical protein
MILPCPVRCTGTVVSDDTAKTFSPTKCNTLAIFPTRSLALLLATLMDRLPVIVLANHSCLGQYYLYAVGERVCYLPCPQGAKYTSPGLGCISLVTLSHQR